MVDLKKLVHLCYQVFDYSCFEPDLPKLSELEISDNSFLKQPTIHEFSYSLRKRSQNTITSIFQCDYEKTDNFNSKDYLTERRKVNPVVPSSGPKATLCVALVPAFWN